MKVQNLLLLVTLSSLISCSTIKGLMWPNQKHKKDPRKIEKLTSNNKFQQVYQESANRQKIEQQKIAAIKESSPALREVNKKIKASPKVKVKTVEKIVEVVKYVKVKETPKSKANLGMNYSKKLYRFWIDYFTKRDRDRFIRHMRNAEKIEPIVKRIFRVENIPGELFSVGLIESGYYTKSRSRAAAVGPWQFIRGTATRYGLRVDRQVDERYHFEKATRAAARYLKDLHNIFNSWDLALSAYNAGEYRIINAIRRGDTRNFKKLVSKKLLPNETIYYIPKFFAAKEIYNNRRKYSFPRKKGHDRDWKNAMSVPVKSGFNLSTLAKKNGISYRLLKKLNPDLKTGWLDTKRRKKFFLTVPANVSLPLKGIGSVSKRRVASRSRVKTKHISRHKVRRGENLTVIARRYRTSVAKLRRLNKIRGGRILVGQRLKVPRFALKFYIVRPGDNLTKISRKFGVPISKIKQYNSIKGHRIYPKQKIQIPSKG